MKNINILLIGTGNWGKNYIEEFKKFQNINLIIGTRYDWKKYINLIDGAIIATPPDTHIEIAEYILKHNIPVLIEKPVALSLKETEILKPYSKNILVNYIYLFSDGFNNLIKLGHNINKIITNGFNNTNVRNYSTLWDYGCHDLAMIITLLGMPTHIQCIKNNELYNINLKFNEIETYSTIGINYYKARDITIFTNGLEIKYNDLNRPINHKSPLFNCIFSFIETIKYKKTNGNSGYKDKRFGINLSLDIAYILEKCSIII